MNKKGRANKDMLFHLGLQLGVPLLVTLHPLDLIRENSCHKQWIGEKEMSQTADRGKTDVINSGLGNN